MKRLVALVLGVVSVLAACGLLSGPDRLVADLQAVGMSAAIGTDQDAGIFGGDATTVCVAEESVNVYEYADLDSAIDAAALVDGDDPSMVGNAIIEWAGTPHFWLRDRVIVLYVGDDEAVDAALRTVLGQPFAEGTGPGRGVPGEHPPCERAV